MNRLKLLISGEEPAVLQGLARIFNSKNHFEVLDTVPMSQAGKKASVLQPDVILFDAPPDMETFRYMLRSIKSNCPCCRVLVLIRPEHSKDIACLLEQGLDGCIPQDIRSAGLVKAVDLACQAGVVCLPNFARKSICSFRATHGNSGTKKQPLTGPHSQPKNSCLTNREMEILRLMAKNLSNREICEQLFISEPAVKTHVSHILRKLGQNNRAQAIIYSYQIGLLQ